jgi:hypothetical protein
MRKVCLLQAVLLLSAGLASEAFAGPITGESMVSAGAEAASESRETDPRADVSAFSAASVFDGAGLPLLRLSAPIYMQLTRATGGSQDGGGIQEYFAAPDGSGAVSFQPGLNLTAGLVFGPPPGVQPAQIPEPAVLWLLAPSLLLLRRRLRSHKPPE